MPIIDTFFLQLPVTTKVAELGPELLELIFSKLPALDDCVRLQFGLSKNWRPLSSSRVFEGQPFFLRGPRRGVDSESRPPVARVYAFSMQKWVQLALPPSVRYLKPVSASSGLVLYSGIPREGVISLYRHWWPLVVVNPITRENRLLLLMVEPLPEIEEGYPECYNQVHVGLKVNADSKTYKVVVVYWRIHRRGRRRVVQIYDSGSNQWSSGSVPRKPVSYANSSNEIVLCRTYERDSELDSSVFDIRKGQLVDCRRARLLRAEIAANNNLPTPAERTAWGLPTVGESCLYIVSYNCVFPFTFAHILKREWRSPTWQLVAEVPLDLVSSYLDPDSLDFILDPDTDPESAGLFGILECGKHLLFTVGHHDDNRCGMLYDLDKKRWNGPDAVHLHEYDCDGLFFQPQLNGTPC